MRRALEDKNIRKSVELYELKSGESLEFTWWNIHRYLKLFGFAFLKFFYLGIGIGGFAGIIAIILRVVAISHVALVDMVLMFAMACLSISSIFSGFSGYRNSREDERKRLHC